MRGILLGLVALTAACANRAAEPCPPVRYSMPARPHEVDLLYVVDTSNSTEEEQKNVVILFPAFTQALRPLQGLDLRIGVTTLDLGAAPYTFTSCETGGDGARLLPTPGRLAAPGCPYPRDPWISFAAGASNVVGAKSTDPVAQIDEAFACIGQRGGGGCGFEMPLETARRALDPTLRVNPGFPRESSLVGVLWVTDEDDCSAADPKLFDPNDLSLGQLTSFRCTEHGLICDEPLRPTGEKHHCRSGGPYLVPVDEYEQFYRRLRPEGRLLLAAVAGPAEPVTVGLDGLNPTLAASCKSIMGHAAPGVRIAELLARFGARGLLNRGVDEEGRDVEVNLCSTDYAPALRLLGRRIVEELSAPCLTQWPVTDTGAKIGASCLGHADCRVHLASGDEIPRCPLALFEDPGRRDCGPSCPCWRLRADERCRSDGAPFRVEVLDGERPAQPFATECRALPSPCLSSGGGTSIEC